MEAISIDKISIEEYIALSQEQDQKYEYHDGQIFAIARGTIEHGVIGGNVLGEIGTQLKSKKSSCIPLNSDVRLHVEQGNKIFYPDVMIVCDKIERSASEKNSIINPTVIVEVLSDTTESYDRGDKFHFYQPIPSFKEYILVSQDKPQIDVFKRGIENMWAFRRYQVENEVLKIESIDIDLSFDLIYRNVIFNP